MATIRKDGGIICDCGNIPERRGFFPVTPYGKTLMDEADRRWRGHYRCDKCGQVTHLPEAGWPA